jgi:hypothetical protein
MDEPRVFGVRMDRIERIMKVLAYIAVICVAGFQLVPLVQKAANRQGSARTLAKSMIGERVELPAPIPGERHFSLVFGLSTSCVYCKASAPFYRRLVGGLSPSASGHLRTIAILPDDTALAELYVRETLGVQLDSIVQGHPAWARMTPTLLLVNEEGIVKEAWVGEIPPEEEPKVMAAVKRASGT